MILSRGRTHPGRPPERLRDQWCCEVAINPFDLRDRFEGVLPRDAIGEFRHPVAETAQPAGAEQLNLTRQLPPARAQARRAEVQTVTSPRLLLVEDESELRHLYACELEDEGYRVFEAWDERSALVYLELGFVDLVILDVDPGGVSGLGLLKKILARTPRPPVVLCTSDESCRYLESAWQADAFVSKSMDLAELKRQIRQLLDGSVCH